MDESRVFFSSGSSAGIEKLFKNKVNEVLREPVQNIVKAFYRKVDKLVDEKIRAANPKEFTGERRTVLVGIVADEVLANLPRVEDVDGQELTRPFPGESQDEEVEESGGGAGEDDGDTDEESGNGYEQDSGLFLL